jgi:hypothetical protein
MVIEKESFHIDMSGRIYEGKNIGIALVGARTRTHYGCALKGNLIKLIKKRLFGKKIFEDSAKLYSICIYLLIKNVTQNINLLIICNDENFEVVKIILLKLLKNPNFEIINISEFRKRLGRNIGSLADNYANIYRKRALSPNRWSKGRELNVVPVNFTLIEKHWEELK